MSKLVAPTFLQRFGLDKSEQHLSKESTYEVLVKLRKVSLEKDGLEICKPLDEMTIKSVRIVRQNLKSSRARSHQED